MISSKHCNNIDGGGGLHGHEHVVDGLTFTYAMTVNRLPLVRKVN